MLKIKEIKEERNIEFDRAFNNIKKVKKIPTHGYLPEDKRIKLDVFLAKNRLSITEWLESQVDNLESY